MYIIRETSHYATQLEVSALKAQAERQLSFANTWLNFVRKKKSTDSLLKHSTTLPMWLIPGIQFLHYICSLNFTNHIDDEIFDKFYRNLQRTVKHLRNSNGVDGPKLISSYIRPRRSSKSLPISSTREYGRDKQKPTADLTRIQLLELMDRKIDRQRFKHGLIGKVVKHDERSIKMSLISKRMEEDLAILKIRNFHKLKLLARGQFATSELMRIEQGRKTTSYLNMSPDRSYRDVKQPTFQSFYFSLMQSTSLN